MLNKTVMMGRLTKDVEIKVLNENVSVANFSIAVERNYKMKNEEKPQTDFFDCVCWNKTGETIARLFKKANTIILIGHFENDNYEKNGVKVYHDVFVVEEFHFSGEKKAED